MGVIKKMDITLPDPIPTHFESAGFQFEVLHPGHVDLDYQALMASKDFLRRWSNSSWPEDTFTIQDNLNDLEWHYDEFKEKTAFTYTILNLEKNHCLGCIYIRPVASLLSISPEELSRLAAFHFFVSYWVIDSIRDTALENQIFSTLYEWLQTDWHFPTPLFTSNHNIQEQNKFYQYFQFAVYLEIKLNERYQLFWTTTRG